MSNKKLFIRNIESSPPSEKQLNYLQQRKAELVSQRQENERRVAVQISSSAFILCDPEEEKYYRQQN